MPVLTEIWKFNHVQFDHPLPTHALITAWGYYQNTHCRTQSSTLSRTIASWDLGRDYANFLLHLRNFKTLQKKLFYLSFHSQLVYSIDYFTELGINHFHITRHKLPNFKRSSLYKPLDLEKWSKTFHGNEALQKFSAKEALWSK